MFNRAEPIARRALLKKDGVADIRFELHRNRSRFDFSMIENGKNVGPFWKILTPQQTLRGDALDLRMDSVWPTCIGKRFPGYTATEIEDCFPGKGAA